MALVQVRGVEIFLLIGRPDDDEVGAEGDKVALEPDAKVPIMGAKLKRDRVVTGK
jgi:hypothetical protein